MIIFDFSIVNYYSALVGVVNRRELVCQIIPEGQSFDNNYAGKYLFQEK